ncbi:MAG: leucine-rich repeat protein [Bacteroidales bacterium]|nr:leucine-rich repeat protein [Bacteroidales bacterium]
MKKTLLSLLMAVVAVAASAAVGDTFTVGELNYKVTGDATASTYAAVQVTGLSSAGASVTALNIPSTVKNGTEIYTVRTIAASAFAGNTKLQSVRVKYGITTIYESAFKGCTSITSVRLSSSVRAIGSNAFGGCSALKTVYIANPDPTKMSNYNAAAFPGNFLMALYVPMTGTDVVAKYASTSAFNKFAQIKRSSLAYDWSATDGTRMCVTGAPSKTIIGEVTMVGFNVSGSAVVDSTYAPKTSTYTFENYKYNMVAIADSACAGNTNLKAINLADGIGLKIKAIPNYAFQGCTRLKVANIYASSITSIGAHAFGDCAALDTLKLGANVASIDITSVDGASAMEVFEVNPNNKTYASEYGLLLNADKTKLIKCPANNYFGKYPYTLNTIGSYAFSGNKVISSFVPPAVNFEDNALSNMEQLSKLRIRSGVKQWGNDVVRGCTYLSELYFNKETPPVISKTSFEGTAMNHLYVPNTAVEAYQNAVGWKEWPLITKGAYDILDSDIGYLKYTIHSRKEETINGKKYNGRLTLVEIPNKIYYGPINMRGELNGFIITKIAPNVSDFDYDAVDRGYTFNLGANIDTICDSAFKQSKIWKINLNNRLKFIGDSAFYHSLTGYISEIPSSCTYIGEKAFVNSYLEELVIRTPSEGSRYVGKYFYGGKTKCYVSAEEYPEYKKHVASWSTLGISEAWIQAFTSRLNAFFEVENGDSVSTFSVDYPVDWKQAKINAYTATAYDAAKRMVTTQKVDATADGEGVIITGYEQNTLYKLERPAATPAAGTNLLVGSAKGKADVIADDGGFYFDAGTNSFLRPATSYTLAAGHAYLKLTPATAGSTQQVYIDLWAPKTKVGDVNGDGEVNVSDVTALINKILGSADYADEVCDINADGVVNVSDVTALINKILG